MAEAKGAKQNRYNAKTYDVIHVRVRKDGNDEFLAEEVRAAAEAAGESINAFILQAIRERLAQI